MMLKEKAKEKKSKKRRERYSPSLRVNDVGGKERGRGKVTRKLHEG